MGWLFLCMTGLVGNIGNWAHVVGLIVGILIVLTPIYLRDGKIG
jgi:membrane associated rhomboid family serine protease